jgi:hypothetical protein
MLLASASLAGAAPPQLAFRTQEIETGLKVGYAVSLADVNGDGHSDILVVDSQRVVWYENPSWQRHTALEGQTASDNVCIAPRDIDGDGRLDLALGAGWKNLSTTVPGTIQWVAQGASPAEPWELRHIDDEPSVHRMRWVDIDGDGQTELVVLPLLGHDTTKPDYAEHAVRILAYDVPTDPRKDRWQRRVLDESLHVTHNFYPTDMDGDGRPELLVASFEGVNLLTAAGDGTWPAKLIGSGNQTSTPNRGASEIKRGRLASGADYIATVEPWHGFQVVVYTRPAGVAGDGNGLWNRQVVDEDLKWGHAVWCVDLDADGDEELAIGVRDDKSPESRCGLRIYDPTSADGTAWKRTLVDAGGVNIEDLAAADLDGDGRVDLVASGRQSHNVRIYWNQSR